MFIHVVFFWCKDGTPDTAKQEMIRYAHEQMPSIPSVKHVWASKAVPSPRAVVDSSYDVGLCVVFADKAGHDSYQPHEIHQEFVRQFQGHWERVRVQDFE